MELASQILEKLLVMRSSSNAPIWLPGKNFSFRSSRIALSARSDGEMAAL